MHYRAVLLELRQKEMLLNHRAPAAPFLRSTTGERSFMFSAVKFSADEECSKLLVTPFTR